jgi:CBS domain containing-hemolysin-like protein
MKHGVRLITDATDSPSFGARPLDDPLPSLLFAADPSPLLHAATSLTSVLSVGFETTLCLLIAVAFACVRQIFQHFGPAKARKAVKKGGLHFAPLADAPDRVLTEMRLGQRLAVATATILMFEALSSLPWAGAITVVAITLSTVFLVEAIPRWLITPAIADRLAGSMLRITSPWRWFARPFAFVIERLGANFSRHARADEDADDDLDRLTTLIADLSVSDPDAQIKLKQELAFGDTVARAVMMPRGDVTTCSADTPPDVLAKHLLQYSRIPIYQHKIDNIIGVLYAKDVLHHLLTHPNQPFDLKSIKLREAFFVPESRQVRDLFEDMRSSRVHIAVVIDEFGSFAGVVSMEDIVELFFGDIQDEYDAEESLFSSLGPYHILADAKLDIAALASVFDVEFPDDRDYDTLGGFITEALGHVPLPEESFESMGLKFTVRDANPRRVIRAEVRREAPQAPSPSAHHTKITRPQTPPSSSTSALRRLLV